MKPKKTTPRPYLVAKTQNGRDIQKALEKGKQDPRTYKDWVLLVGSQMMEWRSTYNVTRLPPESITSEPAAEPQPVDFGVTLVHKSQLRRFIGDLSDKWWHRSLGRRVQQKGPT